MQLSSADQRLLQRFHDREMGAEESVAFRRRLENEPDLRRGLAALEKLSGGFVAGREPAFAAPAGFTAGLLAEVRQLPGRIALQEAELSAGALTLCRRVLLVATILFGLGLCWQAGLFDVEGATTLEATPVDEVEREMKRLDAIVQSWDGSPGRSR